MSAIPLPWPSDFRFETLRHPLSVEFALFISINTYRHLCRNLNFNSLCFVYASPRIDWTKATLVHR
jgi:hypothetical protein